MVAGDRWVGRGWVAGATGRSRVVVSRSLVDWFRGWIGGLVVCMSLVEQIDRGWSWVGRGSRVDSWSRVVVARSRVEHVGRDRASLYHYTLYVCGIGRWSLARPVLPTNIVTTEELKQISTRDIITIFIIAWRGRTRSGSVLGSTS